MSRFENRRQHYLNFEYKPDCPLVALEAAVKWLEGLPAITGPCVDKPAWALAVQDTGKRDKELRGRTCHLSLQGTPIGPRACVAFPFSNRAITKTFEEYIRYDSFISGYILAETESGIVVSADIPAILLQNIAIICRHSIELATPQFETFNKLVGEGVPGDIAYPVSFCRPSKAEMDWRVSGDWGHRAWTRVFSIEAMKNFISGNFFFEGDPKRLFRMSTGLRGGSRLCWPLTGRNVYTSFYRELFSRGDFVEGLKTFRSPLDKVYTPPNPFTLQTAQTLGEYDITYKELYEYVVPYALKEGVFNVEENK